MTGVDLTKKDFVIQGEVESGFWLYIPKLAKKFEITKFRDDVLQALRLKKLVEKWLEDSDIPAYGDWTYHNLTKFLEESKDEQSG